MAGLAGCCPILEQVVVRASVAEGLGGAVDTVRHVVVASVALKGG